MGKNAVKNAVKKKAYILGGGTFSHVRSHLALAAPAFGQTARDIANLCDDSLDVGLVLTRMAGGSRFLETGDNVELWVRENIIDALDVKIVFFNVAMVDFDGAIGDVASGKYATRLQSRDVSPTMELDAAPKVISKIREKRKDIFLVGFKTTCGATPQEQYLAGLGLVKGSSCNLVLANDTRTRTNMIITPEEATYCVTSDRATALGELVKMAYLRSHLTFTRSTVIAGNPVPWTSSDVPDTLREVVDFCVADGAYKEFRGATVGHFAVKLNETTFLTSRRKTNFNDLDVNGLVRVKTDGPDSVLAYGSKPSVGGQSQRIVFSTYPDDDCIVHFHCPLRGDAPDDIPVVSQREFECGSHECGKNTASGLRRFGDLHAVMLDNHGPNIVFSSKMDSAEIIDFISRNFDLSAKTGGFSLGARQIVSNTQAPVRGTV